jgi:hypothetical protein
MMFLIRTAFWLAVVIMLIPVDDQTAAEQSTAHVQPVAAVEAASAAQATLRDVGGFCSRNPTACDIGGRIGTTFLLKARSGARLAYDFLDSKLNNAPATADVDHGTLSASDLTPAWHAPKPGQSDI